MSYIDRVLFVPRHESTLTCFPTFSVFAFFFRRQGKRVSSVMEGGQEVLKRESMGRRFKGELRDLVERIHSTEVCDYAPIFFITALSA